MMKASWDKQENAQNYVITYRREMDCMPHEVTHITEKSSLLAPLKHENDTLEDLRGSTYVFNLRVNTVVNDSIIFKPKADEQRIVVDYGKTLINFYYQ